MNDTRGSQADGSSPIETDAVIIGAGPAGLFQAFQLGLLEIDAHIIDALPYAGGQCIELYPDKPIYDIPGVPRCTGRELVANLLTQLAPFKPALHLGRTVTTFEQQDDARFLLACSHGPRFLSRCVFIAAGLGAFQPKLLQVPGLGSFRHHQVFYPGDRVASLVGKHVLVVGGDAAALGCIARLAALGTAASLTLLHRRDVYDAPAPLLQQITALGQARAIRVLTGQIQECVAEKGLLKAVQVTLPNGEILQTALDALLIFQGLSPKLGPIAGWGLELERKQLPVDTKKFETRLRGVFAVGDINTYPGKKKLMLSAFHECALAAFGAAEQLRPDAPPQLQYTTTSTRLHRLLGISSAPS